MSRAQPKSSPTDEHARRIAQAIAKGRPPPFNDAFDRYCESSPREIFAAFTGAARHMPPAGKDESLAFGYLFLLQRQKQITKSKRLILAGRRHVASRAGESGKDFAWGAFAVPIEGIVERGRSTLGDRLRDPSRMFIRRRRLWLGPAHRATSENQATVAGIYGAAMSKSAKSTPVAPAATMHHAQSRRDEQQISRILNRTPSPATTLSNA